jgi:signal transduction histidine kinase
MSPEEIPIALTPLGQVNAGLQRKYEGTVLGVAIAKRLVEMHGRRAGHRQRARCRHYRDGAAAGSAGDGRGLRPSRPAPKD